MKEDFVETVKKLAGLARIGLKEGEDVKLGKEIESILGYLAEIQKVAGTHPPLEIGPLHTVLREDTQPTPPGTYADALLREVPNKEGRYVAVKKIL